MFFVAVRMREAVATDRGIIGVKRKEEDHSAYDYRFIIRADYGLSALWSTVKMVCNGG